MRIPSSLEINKLLAQSQHMPDFTQMMQMENIYCFDWLRVKQRSRNAPWTPLRVYLVAHLEIDTEVPGVLKVHNSRIWIILNYLPIR